MHPFYGIGSEKLNAEKKFGSSGMARLSAGGRHCSAFERQQRTMGSALDSCLLIIKSNRPIPFAFDSFQAIDIPPQPKRSLCAFILDKSQEQTIMDVPSFLIIYICPEQKFSPAPFKIKICVSSYL